MINSRVSTSVAQMFVERNGEKSSVNKCKRGDHDLRVEDDIGLIDLKSGIHLLIFTEYICIRWTSLSGIFNLSFLRFALIGGSVLHLAAYTYDDERLINLMFFGDLRSPKHVVEIKIFKFHTTIMTLET